MSKIIWGKVTSTQEADKDTCKCYARDAQFYINDIDYMRELRYTNSPVSYVAFHKIPEQLRDIEFGVYETGVFSKNITYEQLLNYSTEIVLNRFYLSETTEYMSTCYSEWTCGEPGEETFVRLGELKGLSGKYIILKMD